MAGRSAICGRIAMLVAGAGTVRHYAAAQRRRRS